MSRDKVINLRNEVAWHLDEIAKLFKQRPKMTIVIRADWLPNGDVILTDDDQEKAIAAIRRLHEKPDILIPAGVKL